MDCSLPGSSVHGIFQARVLERVAVSFFRGSSWPRGRAQVSLIAGRCFTIWATWEATRKSEHPYKHQRIVIYDVKSLKKNFPPSFKRIINNNLTWSLPENRKRINISQLILWGQNNPDTKTRQWQHTHQRKLETSVSIEFRWEIPQQNISKLIQQYRKENCILWPNRVYSRYAGLFQHQEIISVKLKKKNHVITSTNMGKKLTKSDSHS